MARTSLEIEEQIEKLRQEAEALKAKEMAGVIQKVREAIAQYGLTSKDLFGSGKATKRVTAKRSGNSVKPAKVIKYRDDAGNAWTGRGTRPRWFKAALAAGKTAEDLLVK